MAFTGNAMCTSFKKELAWKESHDFTNSSGKTFTNLLYTTNSASFTAATTDVHFIKRSG